MALTITFSPKATSCASDMLAITVSSKSTKDDLGNTVPAPFSPFVVILPSSYLAGIRALPAVFQPACEQVLSDEIKKLATARKLAGMESVILQDDAEKQLRLANEDVSLSVANIVKFFDAVLVPTFSTIADTAKREKQQAAWLAEFRKLANGYVSEQNAEKMLSRLARVETDSPLLSKLTSKLESCLETVELED